MTSVPHPTHDAEELCPAGRELYERALREGHVPAEAARATPCLLDFGLLHPAVDDLHRLEPVVPAVALRRLLRISGERIASERRREERLAETFGPLLAAPGHDPAAAGTPTLTLLSGKERINRAITEAMADASRELLTVQPRARITRDRIEAAYAVATSRDQALLDRGGRIRTLYQHTLRHSPLTVAHQERLTGDIEARALDEVTDRLIVVDRAIAFLPADTEGALALEIRHPAIVGYLATAFDRLWRLATPVFPEALPQPSLNGVTPRQHAIAALLVEGHTDAVIADRLGMNIRTARVHIAKLAATLGSQSRAQLGFLIGRSGILDREA
ncbi:MULTISPECIES: helix-turn-helix transcriptional regulator [Streptomyces]|uniref:Helix-turn-helix transcriptional regulator n=1 Tax=Streptomyces koelreuteriae TaxID=2838015 RepID=A0ABX8FSW4_9ACTN|nr:MULTISPECIES: helix-turn-helix transcriptional regulator [Streptomyces]QWB24183.1 helix-turn-helix transcriptional regulator [Streptomyces koelreuteriae]UUA07174.1 helix-turn-helix transcriptional regulator [Streptomyces koelreuteriae]UUA14803.1 helix-turn-helix transcriptional regulator [Streptomyces sp. CRCS-T-1]